jgi:hypothetical protein
VIASGNSQRQARLRAEYAEQYPGLQPGVWFAAVSVSELLIARARTRRGTRDFAQRSLNPRHFEFRGGLNGESRSSLKSRASDP